MQPTQKCHQIFFVIHQARCDYLAGVHSVLMNPYSSAVDIEISLPALHTRLEDNSLPQEQKHIKGTLNIGKEDVFSGFVGHSVKQLNHK